MEQDVLSGKKFKPPLLEQNKSLNHSLQNNVHSTQTLPDRPLLITARERI